LQYQAAKRQTLPMVGTVFLRKSGGNHIGKIDQSVNSFLLFYQRGCDLIFGIFIIPFVVLGNFFSFHISDQRKEAKESRLFNHDILNAFYLTTLFFS
jgi:hypothetical protein